LLKAISHPPPQLVDADVDPAILEQVEVVQPATMLIGLPVNVPPVSDAVLGFGALPLVDAVHDLGGSAEARLLKPPMILPGW
jgi:hypothetical protein